tara:strand:- start:4 stop:414 length:411 start_codon:yes stop_codon:yes gene_type:complete
MKNMNIAIAFGFLVITLFGVYYYQDILLGKYQNSNPSNPQAAISKVDKQNLIERKFNVKGMFCEACKVKIEKSVGQIDGVSSVLVNQETNEMIVNYEPGKEYVKQTLDTIKGLGYTAGLKSQSGKLQVLDFNVTFQ